MDECTTEESGWTKAHLQKLLNVMKSSIPEKDRMSVYTKGLKTIDWNKVAFPPFSPEECQEKWKDIFQKMRKMRTLTELIDEAENVISYPVLNSKIHPQLPKRPIPPNAIFCEKNWVKYNEKHPEMSKPELFMHLNKEYASLPDEEKGKYVKMFELANEEYCKRMQEFSKEYKTKPHRAKRKRKRLSADVPDGREGQPPKPLKPPINGRNLFYKEKSECATSSSGKNDVAAASKHWQDLTEEEKDEYSVRCRELNHQYAVKMDEYLQTCDQEEQQQILNESGIRKKNRKFFSGEPKMPPRAGNAIFIKKQMSLLKDEFPSASERLTMASQMWHDLSCREKEPYRAEAQENMREYAIKLQRWFETLSEEEQKDYLTSKPRQMQYFEDYEVEELNGKDARAAVHGPSDSEDEDIEDSSSDEEDNSRCIEVMEEEDDEIIAFEMI